jgi:hypothetical protein
MSLWHWFSFFFFKCSIEFIREAIWVWGFLCKKFLNYWFNLVVIIFGSFQFFNFFLTISIIYVPLRFFLFHESYMLCWQFSYYSPIISFISEGSVGMHSLSFFLLIIKPSPHLFWSSSRLVSHAYIFTEPPFWVFFLLFILYFISTHTYFSLLALSSVCHFPVSTSKG